LPTHVRSSRSGAVLSCESLICGGLGIICGLLGSGAVEWVALRLRARELARLGFQPCELCARVGKLITFKGPPTAYTLAQVRCPQCDGVGWTVRIPKPEATLR
jgi:hypothetical protein